MARIKELNAADRPREKLTAKGAQALSDAELIQVIIGSGVQGADVIKISRQVKKLLDTEGYALNLEQLNNIRGVNKATATKLVALFELATRHFHKDFKVETAVDAAALVPELKDAKQEHLIVISLDGASRVINKRTVSIGTLNSSLIHPREVFADPLSERAASIIIIHNHPSGGTMPGKADIEVTKRLKDAGKLLGIKVLDHIIITKNEHKSIK